MKMFKILEFEISNNVRLKIEANYEERAAVVE